MKLFWATCVASVLMFIAVLGLLFAAIWYPGVSHTGQRLMETAGVFGALGVVFAIAAFFLAEIL